MPAASIHGKRLSQRMDAAVLTGYQLAIGGLALVCLGIWRVTLEEKPVAGVPFSR